MSLVLFCGGSKNGHWGEVAMGLQEIHVHVPTRINWNQDAKVVHEERRERYRIWNIQILGYGMRVATADDARPESDDVIRAIVQRDVADVLTNRRVTR